MITDFTLEIRYASFVDTDIRIGVDGKDMSTYYLENTKEEFIWRTAQVPIELEKGKHTVRITVDKGMSCMNWLRFK